MDTLVEDSPHVRVGQVNCKGFRSTGFRVSKDGNGGEKELGTADGGVKNKRTMGETCQGLGGCQ